MAVLRGTVLRPEGGSIEGGGVNGGAVSEAGGIWGTTVLQYTNITKAKCNIPSAELTES